MKITPLYQVSYLRINKLCSNLSLQYIFSGNIIFTPSWFVRRCFSWTCRFVYLRRSRREFRFSSRLSWSSITDRHLTLHDGVEGTVSSGIFVLSPNIPPCAGEHELGDEVGPPSSVIIGDSQPVGDKCPSSSNNRLYSLKSATRGNHDAERTLSSTTDISFG